MAAFLAARARLSFWCAMIPGFAFLIWGLSRFGSGAGLWLYVAFAVWAVAAFVLINRQAWRLCRPALDALDHRCDPEPLLEVCRMVLRQNPDSLYFRVYESYALNLLGREEESRQSAERAGANPRLWKDPHLLLVWSASLPMGDSRQERALDTLEKLRRRLPPHGQETLAQILSDRQALNRLEADDPALEALLTSRLARAGCLREEIGAHLALGAYYVHRKNLAAEEHLNYVLDNANKLHGARHHAERMLCLLPKP